jgi:hypothetical protein
MTKPCKVSVIIPGFNKWRIYARGLWEQDDIESIVVDDSCADEATHKEMDALPHRRLR